eukprot:PhF_6_TR33474/c0_g1_i1/m.48817
MASEAEDVELLREIIQDLTEQRSELQSQVMELELANRSLSNQLKEIKTDIESRMSFQTTNIHEYYTALKEEHGLMVVQATNDIKEIRQLKHDNAMLACEVQSLQRKIDSSEGDSFDSFTENEILKQSNAALALKVSQLCEQVAMLTSKVEKYESEDFQSFYYRKCATPKEGMEEGSGVSPSPGAEPYPSSDFRTNRATIGIESIIGEKGVLGAVD